MKTDVLTNRRGRPGVTFQVFIGSTIGPKMSLHHTMELRDKLNKALADHNMARPLT